jgi:hypothetical protein
MISVRRIWVESHALMEETWEADCTSGMLQGCAHGTYLFQRNLATTHNAITPPTLYRTCFKFWSEKVVAFCRLAISSNWGCRHVPVTGVAGEAGLDAGVAGVDIFSQETDAVPELYHAPGGLDQH